MYQALALYLGSTKWHHHRPRAGTELTATRSPAQRPAEHSSGPGASTKERSLQASEMPGKPTPPSRIQTSRLPPPSPDKLLPRNTTEIPRKFILFLPGLNRNRTRENLEPVYFLPVMKPAWHRKTPQCLPLHEVRSCPGHVEHPHSCGATVLHWE